MRWCGFCVTEHGPLTCQAERELYATDRPRWVRYAARAIALRIAQSSDSEVARMWSVMGRDLQGETWAHLDQRERERVKRVRN